MGERPVLDYDRPEPKRRPSRTSWLLKLLAAYVLIGIAVIVVDQMTMLHSQRTRGQVKCASNLRQIGQAIDLYLQDTRGRLPPDLQTVYTTQQGPSLDCFICPDTTDTPAPTPDLMAVSGHCSYIYVGADLISKANPNCILAMEDPANHWPKGANVLFADDHVEFLDLPTIQHILNELNAGRNPPSTLTPTLSQAAAEKDYQTNWKPRMPQLKSGVWHIPSTQPSAAPT